jgi:dihydrofolate reductase
MRKLVVGTFLTLDGVMQAPGAPDEDRDGGFANGGWVVPLFDDELGASMTEWIEGIGALLLGRRTYEIFASHWPLTGPDDPIGAAFARVPRYVASRTLRSPGWEGTTVIEDVPAAVRALKEEDGDEIQVHGSGGLIRTLLREDLVDELRLVTFPVVVGGGKRLFGDDAPPAAFELAGATVFPSGTILHTYRRAGALSQGAFGLETQ